MTNDPVIACHGLSRSFKMGDATVDVLRGVDFAVRPGEFVAIEGRSGSGKSTLLHLLAGLDTPNEGSIQYAGHDLADLARSSTRRANWLPRRLAFLDSALALPNLVTLATDGAGRKLARLRNENFGFVFQFYHLLPEMSVLENAMTAAMIRYGRSEFRRNRSTLLERAGTILDSLGMGHRLKHRPSQLSGGERQRVAIARALMNEPRVLFADEPTGNLDVDTGAQIMGVLEGLHRRGQTIVMVTHDRSVAKQADRVVVLTKGRMEEKSAAVAE